MSTVKGKVIKATAITSQKVQTDLVSAYTAVLEEQFQSFKESLVQERKDFDANLTELALEWDKELARKKEEDVYQFNKEKRDRADKLEVEIADRLEAVSAREAKVKEREVTIGDAEVTITKLQSVVDAIPAITAKSESTGYAKGLAEATKEANAEARIKEATTNAGTQILESRIEALQAVVHTQVETISNLQEELKAANARVQEIANNAVTSAGGSKVTVQNAPATNGR